MNEELINKINALMYEYHSLKNIYDELDEQKKKLDEKMKDIESQYKPLGDELVELMKQVEEVEHHNNGIVASLMHKEGVKYVDENATILKLMELGRADMIRVKQELNKVALNKALKNDVELSEALGAVIEKTSTDYIVVTTEEKHERMLEHIKENTTKR